MKKQRDIQDRVEVVLLGLTFFAALVAAISTYKAAVHTNQQVQIAKEALADARSLAASQNRAYAYFNGLKLRPYPVENPNIVGLEFSITNSGNTPARKVTMRKICVDLPAGDDPWAAPAWAELANQPARPIGPRDSIELQGCNISLELIKKAQTGATQIFFMADISYEDIFDTEGRYRTQLTSRIFFDKDGGHSFGFVGPHNCTDQDCPPQ